MSRTDDLVERGAEALRREASRDYADPNAPRWSFLVTAVLAEVRETLPPIPAPPKDCCANEAWRGRLCTYHEGFADGWGFALQAIANQTLGLSDPRPSEHLEGERE